MTIPIVDLVSHVLQSGDIIPDIFNEANQTSFTLQQLQQCWIDFLQQQEPLMSQNDLTPKIPLQEINLLPQRQHLLQRLSDQTSRRKQPLPRTILSLKSVQLTPSSKQINKPLTQFLSFCELEFEVLQQSKKIIPQAFAMIQSLQTKFITKKDQTYLHSFSTFASPKNAAVYFDIELNQFCLVNCGYDGDQNEGIGVEIQGTQLKNGQKAGLGKTKRVFRVAGVWHLWRWLSD